MSLIHLRWKICRMSRALQHLNSVRDFDYVIACRMIHTKRQLMTLVPSIVHSPQIHKSLINSNSNSNKSFVHTRMEFIIYIYETKWLNGWNGFQFQTIIRLMVTVHCPLTEIANIELFWPLFSFLFVFLGLIIWFLFGVEKVFDFTFSEIEEKLMAKWLSVNHKQHTNLTPPHTFISPTVFGTNTKHPVYKILLGIASVSVSVLSISLAYIALDIFYLLDTKIKFIFHDFVHSS